MVSTYIESRSPSTDYIEMESGEVHRGKIRPATRESLREWLDEFTETVLR